MKSWYYLKPDTGGRPRPVDAALFFLLLLPAMLPSFDSVLSRARRAIFRFPFLFALAATIAAFHSSHAAALEFTKQPYLQNVTKTSIVICWETDEPAPGKISYAAAKKPAGDITLKGSDTFREVKLKSLKEDTEYTFTVRAGALEYSGGFKTAPPAGKPFRFIAFGDMHVGLGYMPTINKIAAEKPDIVLGMGDNVHNGHNEQLWKTFFGVMNRLIRATPCYYVLGNHEDNTSIHFKYFSMPGNEHWYSFDYGNAHFTALDSNMPYKDYPEQKKFLETDLAAARANRDTAFIFVFFHHPPFATSIRCDPMLKEKWVPIFEKYKVDAVLSGHEHFYERSYVKGVTYIVTAGAGPNLYEFRYDDPATIVKAARQHYVVFDVDKKVVRIKTIALEGDVIDKTILDMR